MKRLRTLYKIADWHEHFEHSDSEKVKGPLKWIPVPTKTDGLGFSQLKRQSDRANLLAAWHLMLGVSAKQPRELRGSLSRGGKPLDSEALEMMTGFPREIFDRAFDFFSDPEQGWLIAESCEISQGSEKDPPTSEDRKLKDKTTKDPVSSPAAPVDESEFDQIWEAYPKKSGKKQAKPEIVAAIKSKGFPFILEAVKAYAAAVGQWQETDRKFVPDPVRWFKRGHYDDDRSTWQRTGTPAGVLAKRSDSVWALRQRQEAVRAEIHRIEYDGKGYRGAAQCQPGEMPGSYWKPGCEEKWRNAKKHLAELEAQIGGINADDLGDR